MHACASAPMQTRTVDVAFGAPLDTVVDAAVEAEVDPAVEKSSVQNFPRSRKLNLRSISPFFSLLFLRGGGRSSAVVVPAAAGANTALAPAWPAGAPGVAIATMARGSSLVMGGIAGKPFASSSAGPAPDSPDLSRPLPCRVAKRSAT